MLLMLKNINMLPTQIPKLFGEVYPPVVWFLGPVLRKKKLERTSFYVLFLIILAINLPFGKKTAACMMLSNNFYQKCRKLILCLIYMILYISSKHLRLKKMSKIILFFYISSQDRTTLVARPRNALDVFWFFGDIFATSVNPLLPVWIHQINFSRLNLAGRIQTA